MDKPSLKSSVAWVEDSIIVLSGPALAVSGIVAGVDLVTGGQILRSISWLALVWAITLLLTLDFQVLCLGVRAHRVYASNKSKEQKIFEIVLAVLIAAAISYVSIQMQSIIARVNAENITLDQASMQLGINMIWLIWERSTLVLVLIFMSGWLRETDHQDDKTPVQPPDLVATFEEKLNTLALAEAQAREAMLALMKQELVNTVSISMEEQKQLLLTTGQHPAVNIPQPTPANRKKPGKITRIDLVRPVHDDKRGRVRRVLMNNPQASVSEIERLAKVSRGYASKLRSELLPEIAEKDVQQAQEN
jgi:hypothetical protein